MKLLLISNSTMPGEAYLDYPKYEIKKFLGDKPLTALIHSLCRRNFFVRFV